MVRLADYVKPADERGWALWLAERGLHVFRVDHPDNDKCCQHGADCDKRGKHPFGRWTLHGTTDPNTIRRKDWWGGDRLWNIGIDCGKSGLLVVDEDNLNGLAKYAADHGVEIPPTFVVRTREGRKHYYFHRQPGGHGNSPGALKAYGCDVRGNGGYVVGPGSTHETGKVYTPDSLNPIADMPDWLAQALVAKPAEDQRHTSTGEPGEHQGWAAVGFAEELRALLDTPEGGRNEALNRCAYKGFRKVAGGLLDETEVETQLIDAAQDIGLDSHEIAPTIESARRAAMNNPEYGPTREAESPAFERLVKQQFDRLRAQEEAKRLLLGDERPPIPAIRRLTDFLAEPDEAEDYRIRSLWPTGGNILLAAQSKSGKTTLRDNAIKSLVDGAPLLGRFGVKRVTGSIAVLDLEMPERTARRWFRDQGIKAQDRVMFVGLRGREAAFDVLDQRTRNQWVEQLRELGCEVLILDCLGPLLSSLGMDENDQLGVGRVLSGIRQLATDAGIAELMLIHHMGHNGERSRGASRLRDWPDAEWRLLNADEDDRSGPKFFTAHGRDVWEPEGELAFDLNTRRLTLLDEGRTRKEAKSKRTEATLDSVVAGITAYLQAHEPASGNQIEKNVTGKAATIRTALKAGIERNRFRRDKDGYWLAAQGVLGDA